MGHLPHLRGAPRCLYLEDVRLTAAEELRTWVVIPVSDPRETPEDELVTELYQPIV